MHKYVMRTVLHVRLFLLLLAGTANELGVIFVMFLRL